MRQPRFHYPTPLVGSYGVFELSQPFETLPGELFQCVAVRRISAWIMNNDDPWDEVYLPKGLTEQEYEEHREIDLELVTLVNDRGFRVVVPANYVLKFPVQDGVPYRGVGIHVALPAFPIEQDLTFLTDAIKELVQAKAGVECETELIETSSVQMLDPIADEAETEKRQMAIGMNGSDYAKNQQLLQDLETARGKIQMLEAYILANFNGP